MAERRNQAAAIAGAGGQHDAARLDAPLDPTSYRALARLVARYGWPAEPCATAPAIVALLTPERPVAAAVAHVVLSAVSGRVLEAEGDTKTRWPPGSLMKIPYAAALSGVDPRRILLLAAHPLEFVGQDVERDHRRAFVQERLDDGAADPASAAGHHDVLAVEARHARPFGLKSAWPATPRSASRTCRLPTVATAARSTSTSAT